ncbi:hypothetical protein C8Q74DRAFT_1304099 [Fomes fomentarius]|nr:hypothetical protein C8Q74DRAFT_1304099 [Fomes fomentarius]
MARHVPAAPRLDIDREVHVFVHHTAPGSGMNHRYRILGEEMLKMAYTAALFNTRPDLAGTKLQVYAEGSLPGFASIWVERYGWRTRMCAVPQGVNLNSLEETLGFFQTYIGAVCEQYGSETVTNWITQLVQAKSEGSA